MAFFFIIGMKFIAWGSERMPGTIRCGECGTVAQFIRKSGMRFLTLFFVIPVLPLSGVKSLAECPTCGARYDVSG